MGLDDKEIDALQLASNGRDDRYPNWPDETVNDLALRCQELTLERNRLFALVYWAIGTTEMAISEICDDEEDTADAKEKLRDMKIAVGMDPELDSMDQDPLVMNRINLLYVNRPTR